MNARAAECSARCDGALRFPVLIASPADGWPSVHSQDSPRHRRDDGCRERANFSRVGMRISIAMATFRVRSFGGSALPAAKESSHAGVRRSRGPVCPIRAARASRAPLLLCCLPDSIVWLARGAASLRREYSWSPCSLPAHSDCRCRAPKYHCGRGCRSARPDLRSVRLCCLTRLLGPRWRRGCFGRRAEGRTVQLGAAETSADWWIQKCGDAGRDAGGVQVRWCRSLNEPDRHRVKREPRMG